MPAVSLSGIQAQLSGNSGGTVANNTNVLLDAVVSGPSENIAYNAQTGNFCISRPGNYYVFWWVNTDSVEQGTSVAFGIRVAAGGSQTILASSPSPLTRLQLSGNALLTVATVPLVFNLFNSSGATVTYGTSAVQANLVAVEVAST